MNLPAWLRRQKGDSGGKELLNRVETTRQQEAVAFDVSQTGNSFKIEGSGIRIDYEVEGMEMPRGSDASFAVWALLPRAMEGGFDLQIHQPVDPVLATNAERLSRIWEMWVPRRYRSVKVSHKGEWSRNRPSRLPQVDLYSGGVDSTFSILQLADPNKRGYALTVDGLDYRDHWAERFSQLIAKTDPLLERLNYQRIIVRTNANYDPISLIPTCADQHAFAQSRLPMDMIFHG